MKTDFLRIGHRGAAAYAAENTLSSIQAALECHVDMVEVDVRRTKDGVLVLAHNATICGQPGRRRVAGSTFDQLQGICLAGGEMVTTLHEALRYLRGRAMVNIDLKVPGIERQVVDMVRSLKMSQQVMISSLSIQSLAEVKTHNNQIFTTLSFPSSFLIRLYDIRWLAPIWHWLAERYWITSVLSRLIRWVLPYHLRLFGHKAAGINAVIIRAPFVSGKLIDLVRQRELQLYVYPVDHAHEADQLRRMGVDGIESNRPDVLRSLSESTAQLAHS